MVDKYRMVAGASCTDGGTVTDRSDLVLLSSSLHNNLFGLVH